MSRNTTPAARAPKIGIFWALKAESTDCTLTTVLWAAAANRTSESYRRPTRLPRLRSAVADYAASASITGVNWLCEENSLVSILKIYLFWGPVRPVRCFVTPSEVLNLFSAVRITASKQWPLALLTKWNMTDSAHKTYWLKDVRTDLVFTHSLSKMQRNIYSSYYIIRLHHYMVKTIV